MNKMRNLLIGLTIITILALGLFVGLLLVNRSAIFNQKASTPTGQATVSLQPASSSFELNTPYSVSVYFNTAGLLSSGVQVRLTFSNLNVTASGIQISQDLLSSGDWSCPVKNISSSGSTGEIDISCTNSSQAGFSATSNTLLATFTLTASSVPVVNPLIVSFDPQNSTITQKSNNSDILLTPTGTGSYTILNTIGGSPTATPIIYVSSPTPIALGTLQPIPTLTPIISTASATPTPTKMPIPVTGFDTPTIIGILVGSLLLAVSIAVIIL